MNAYDLQVSDLRRALAAERAEHAAQSDDSNAQVARQTPHDAAIRSDILARSDHIPAARTELGGRFDDAARVEAEAAADWRAAHARSLQAAEAAYNQAVAHLDAELHRRLLEIQQLRAQLEAAYEQTQQADAFRQRQEADDRARMESNYASASAQNSQRDRAEARRARAAAELASL